MPQAPQLFESDAVFTHSEPQGVCPVAQLLPPPGPVAPVPELPLIDGLEQAAAKIVKAVARAIAKQCPNSDRCSVFMSNLMANLDSRITACQQTW